MDELFQKEFWGKERYKRFIIIRIFLFLVILDSCQLSFLQFSDFFENCNLDLDFDKLEELYNFRVGKYLVFY